MYTRKSLMVIVVAFFTLSASNALAVGFASETNGYLATTINTGNSANADYFTAGLFSDSSCQTPADNVLTSSTIEYSSSGTTRTLNTTSVSLPGLYMKIDKTNHAWNGNTNTFTVTAKATVKFDSTVVNNAVVTLLFDDSDSIVANSTTSSGSTELADGIHSLSFSITNASVEMVSDPTNLVLLLYITVEDVNLGTSASNSSRTLTAVSSAVIVDPTTATSSIEDANQNNPDFNSDDPPYEFKPAVEQHNSQGHEYYSVEVCSTDNAGGIGYQGNVNLSLSIPSGVKFTIHCYGSGTGTSESKTLYAYISIDDSVEKRCNFIYKSSSFSGYIFNNNDDGIFSPVLYTESSNPTQVQRGLNNSDYWMSGVTVNVRLVDAYNNIPDNLHLAICLWPTE